jgi:hypothetical protein
MDLTVVQRRTVEDLLDVGAGRPFDPAVVFRLRQRISVEADAAAASGVRMRLFKERLNDHGRCEGLFWAGLAGEREPFTYTVQTAAGTLLHKAVELDVGAREVRDVRTAVSAAAERLAEDRVFSSYWRELSAIEQDGLLDEVVRRLELFRGTFPPLRELRRRFAPITELFVEASFADGAVTTAGRIDLALGRLDPVRATRVLIDLKTGQAHPEHPEDMRLYALLHTLRFGVPPYRVATLFLSSGVPQAELVDERMLEHAANRVVSAVKATFETQADNRPPELRAGGHCARCPRRASCPEVPKLPTIPSVA